MCECVRGGEAPFRLFQAAENWPGASTCDEVVAKDNISCYQEDGLTVNINIKQRNVDKHSRNDHTCITAPSLPLETNGLRFGGLGDALINLHGRLYIWVFGIDAAPVPSPSQNSGDPLAHNHMVNTEQCPHRSSIIYLRHKPRASRRCFMTTEEDFSSQSRRARSGAGPAASRQVTGSFNSLSCFF